MPIAGRAAEIIIQVLYILAYSIIAYTAIHSLYIVYIYIYNIHVLYSYQEHHEGTQEAIPRQGVEEPVRNPQQADHPYGYQHYTFSDEEPEAVETVEDKFNESYLDKQRQHFESIDRKYQEVRGERYDIDSQLKAFKRKLELPHSVDFPSCFFKMREAIGNYTAMSFDAEQRKIVHSIENDHNPHHIAVREAINIINEMLEKCNAFKENCDASIRFIRDEIDSLKSESVQTTSTESAIKEREGYCKTLATFGQQVVSLVHDIELAEDSLRPLKTTGLLVQLN